jgi:hypothetical protein
MAITFHEKLNAGAFGDVWRATDSLDRQVAVKIIRSAGAGIGSPFAFSKSFPSITVRGGQRGSPLAPTRCPQTPDGRNTMLAVLIIVASFVVAVLGFIQSSRAEEGARNIWGLTRLGVSMIVAATIGLLFGVIKETVDAREAASTQQ